MGRKQRNTVNHFLNKRLKPRVVEINGKEEPAYPVYITIRVNQQQTQLKSFFWLFQVNSTDTISNWDRYSYYKNNDSYAYLTEEQFSSNTSFVNWMEKESSYFLRAVEGFSKVINKDLFDVKLIGKHLFDLTLPVHLIISEYYKEKLKLALTNEGQLKVVKVVDWHHNSFWEIMEAFITSFEGVIFNKPDSSPSYKVVSDFLPTYLLVNDLMVLCSKEVIWILEWQDFISTDKVINTFRAQVEKDIYSKASFTDFVSEVGAEMSKLINRVFIESSF
ncbi:hypothetical protein [Roseivirga pacifica]|uniref:hypothetical protein n=1 Tax=Roseivirga pacifica TaxID=1267423 RepID=UPI003BAE85BB